MRSRARQSDSSGHLAASADATARHHSSAERACRPARCAATAWLQSSVSAGLSTRTPAMARSGGR